MYSGARPPGITTPAYRSGSTSEKARSGSRRAAGLLDVGVRVRLEVVDDCAQRPTRRRGDVHRVPGLAQSVEDEVDLEVLDRVARRGSARVPSRGVSLNGRVGAAPPGRRAAPRPRRGTRPRHDVESTNGAKTNGVDRDRDADQRLLDAERRPAPPRPGRLDRRGDRQAVPAHRRARRRRPAPGRAASRGADAGRGDAEDDRGRDRDQPDQHDPAAAAPVRAPARQEAAATPTTLIAASTSPACVAEKPAATRGR